MSFLHVQNRSVPTVENILRRVQIGVVPVSTGGADKDRLALATSTVHCAAARAGLGRIAIRRLAMGIQQAGIPALKGEVSYQR